MDAGGRVQQSLLCVHRLRDGIKQDRTACINRIRGPLAEFGLVYAQGADELQAKLSAVLEGCPTHLNFLSSISASRLAWALSVLC